MSIWLITVAYLIGGIPFALLLARRMGGTDVRYSGSGNIGATNVLRTTGPSTALAVLTLDLGKGYAAVWLARSLGADVGVQGAVAAAVVTGHIFPVWLKFRGGKGVATACGAFALLAPTATLVGAAVFTLVAWLTRYVSLGSIATAALLPPMAYVTGSPSSVVVSALGVMLLVLVRHRGNVRRLYDGTEPSVGDRVS